MKTNEKEEKEQRTSKGGKDIKISKKKEKTNWTVELKKCTITLGTDTKHKTRAQEKY